MTHAAPSPARSGNLIGIDIGGTGIKGGIVDPASGCLQGTVATMPTPQPSTPQAVADGVAKLVQELDSRDNAPNPRSTVGVTFPGIITHGHARSAANLDPSWIDYDITTLFAHTLGRPVKVLNDADAAGVAEVHYGAGGGIHGTVLMLTLGTGIGSAFIFDGQLIPNAELGHLEIDGCNAESKASAVARERQQLTWEEYSQVLQRYLSRVEFLFSPELIIIGGGISVRADEYLPHLKVRTPIIPAALKNDAGIIGATLQASLHDSPLNQSS